VSDERAAGLRIEPPVPGAPVTAVVLVLPGGRAYSHAPARRGHLAYQRMRRFAVAIYRAGSGHGVAVGQLRYRLRGWNGTRRDPVRDAAWALDRLVSRFPSDARGASLRAPQSRTRNGSVPIILIGHSMGGRTALYASTHPAVVAVGAFAPWIEPADPVVHLAGKLLVIAHGDRDQMTDPGASRRYAVRAAAAGARVAHFDVVGDAHAMLRRAADWHSLAWQVVAAATGSAASLGQLAEVLDGPASGRFGVALRPPDREPASA
jgi:dienelactone hydrolase